MMFDHETVDAREQIKMNTKSRFLAGDLLFPIFFVALLITPIFVTSIALFFFTSAGANNLLAIDLWIEAGLLGVMTLSVGLLVYFGIVLITKQKPMVVENLALLLSQAASSLLLIAALTHNPQSEFCKPAINGSAIAAMFQLDSCSLTLDFWMQGSITGLVLAVCFVLSLRFVRTLFRRNFPN
jgi:hypothetical protein